MSDAVEKIITAFISNLPATIASVTAALLALAGWLQSRANARKAAAISQVTSDTNHKAEEVGKQVAIIHDLTNSNLKEVKTALEAANGHIKDLQLLVSKLADGVNGKRPVELS